MSMLKYKLEPLILSVPHYNITSGLPTHTCDKPMCFISTFFPSKDLVKLSILFSSLLFFGFSFLALSFYLFFFLFVILFLLGVFDLHLLFKVLSS
jgi:polyferredoxin